MDDETITSRKRPFSVPQSFEIERLFLRPYSALSFCKYLDIAHWKAQNDTSNICRPFRLHQVRALSNLDLELHVIVMCGLIFILV